jgi:hypothetical protein
MDIQDNHEQESIAIPGLPRVIGTGKDDFKVPEGFDEPLPEEVLFQFEKWDSSHADWDT